VLIAVGVGIGLPRLDASIDGRLPLSLTAYLFGGGPDAARSVLSAVAGSLITVTSLTLSLTVVTLQLASRSGTGTGSPATPSAPTWAWSPPSTRVAGWT